MFFSQKSSTENEKKKLTSYIEKFDWLVQWPIVDTLTVALAGSSLIDNHTAFSYFNISRESFYLERYYNFSSKTFPLIIIWFYWLILRFIKKTKVSKLLPNYWVSFMYIFQHLQTLLNNRILTRYLMSIIASVS